MKKVKNGIEKLDDGFYYILFKRKNYSTFLDYITVKNNKVRALKCWRIKEDGKSDLAENCIDGDYDKLDSVHEYFYLVKGAFYFVTEEEAFGMVI